MALSILLGKNSKTGISAGPRCAFTNKLTKTTGICGNRIPACLPRGKVGIVREVPDMGRASSLIRSRAAAGEILENAK